MSAKSGAILPKVLLEQGLRLLEEALSLRASGWVRDSILYLIYIDGPYNRHWDTVMVKVKLYVRDRGTPYNQVTAESRLDRLNSANRYSI